MSQPTSATKKRASARGYTIVEVMSAMTLFAIGAAGVISMQRVTIQGGADARSFDTASNIAREWEHRLQRDSLRWTEPNSVVSTSNRGTATSWLGDSQIDNTWRVPSAPSPNPGMLAGNGTAFDILGHDVLPTNPERIFCVQYRLSWLATEAAAPMGAVIRAEIRVFWSRLEYAAANCADISVADPLNRNQYHFINVATALRGNPAQ